jgi:cytochrome P450
MAARRDVVQHPSHPRLRARALRVLLRWHERFRPVFTIRLLYAPIVFALGPEANHHITVSHASNVRWRDGGMGDLIPRWGCGLLTTDGDCHRRARRIMLPAFHRERLAASTSVMVEEAERALAGWAPGDRVDLYSCTRRLALRVAMPALFGFNPDHSTRDGEMAEQFEEALGFWGKDYAVQMLRGPGSPWRAMNRARARLDAVIFAEIARRRASGERGPDILSLLLDAEDEDGSSLSDPELRDQVMTLLFAGGQDDRRGNTWPLPPRARGARPARLHSPDAHALATRRPAADRARAVTTVAAAGLG